MKYAIILLTLFFLTLKGYCGKQTSGCTKNAGDSFLFGMLRMLLCIPIGVVLVFAEGAQGQLFTDWGMLAVCALAGFSNAALVATWLFAVQRNSMVLVDVGLTFGSIIPAVLCALLFAEPISLPKMIGFALILLATAVLSGNNNQKARSGAVGILLLVLASISDGLTSFAQQLYKQCYTDGGAWVGEVVYEKSIYHFYSYVFATLSLALFYLLYRQFARKAEKTGDAQAATRAAIPTKVVLHIFIMALCMFAANYLQTVVTNNYGMPSQVLYPVIKGGCLITVNFVAMLFFGEKITHRSIIGSLVALGGIVCMNIL